jgi:DUF4097 and DUF4098 domain-containing protein YvlB
VLRVEFPRASSDEAASLDGASFDLGVPALEGVTLVSSNGAVTSRGFAGTCTVRTSNGDVEVAGHSGDIDIGTSNGGVEVEHVAEDGSIRVETSNASIEVASGGGEVALDLATSNDEVRVSLPAHWAGTVDARTSNDEITIETPDGDHGGEEGHRRVEIGGGGATARIRTSNGGVSVTVS